MIFATNLVAEESSGGLLFTSSSEKVDKRTSLVIFGNNLQKFQDSFSISFDLSIWDVKQFGHIFRAINNNKQEIEFVFVNFYGTDNMYLDFHSPITHKSVQIPITKDAIENKEILSLDINFDLNEDKATIKLRDSVYTCSPIGLSNPSMLQFAFGLYGLNLDVPQMLVKNLKIQSADNTTYFLPLNESVGNYAYDANRKTKAIVKNPEWIVNKHYYWQSNTSFTINSKACVAYDEGRNRIMIISSDSIKNYYPRNNSSESFKQEMNLRDINATDAIYNPYTNQCHILGVDSTASNIFNQNSSDEMKLNYSYERYSLHHNTFFSDSGELYQFGGYSNHTYSDRIYLYDKEKREWQHVIFKGDKLTPRFYSAVGDGINPNEKLIFGGFGNETGKQEHGGHNIYDLHLLDLSNNTIKKLWNLSGKPKTEFIPGSNIILNKEKTHFYALCYSHHIPKTTGYLYRFDLKNGSYEIMSDSISISSEDMSTSVNLFFNKKMNEFYAVVKELGSDNSTKIQIYSLLSPPIGKSQLQKLIHKNRTYIVPKLIYGSIFIIFLAFIILFIYYKRRERTKSERVNAILSSHKDTVSIKAKKPSSIYVFGSFSAFDKKGTDISYRFSMKLRALFALVLIYSDKDSGISTEKLTSYLWPEKDINEAKNIRGVTINRLRNIISDLEGITLVHQNSQWFFKFTEPFYCDFTEYQSILNKLNKIEDYSYSELMEQLVEITANGLFLQNVQDNGIDQYKSLEEDRIEPLIRNYIHYLFEEKQFKRIVQIAPTYFAVEPLNDVILDICLKAYTKLGKRDEAKTFLTNYKKVHKLMTGEEYKKV